MPLLSLVLRLLLQQPCRSRETLRNAAVPSLVQMQLLLLLLRLQPQQQHQQSLHTTTTTTL